MFVVGAAYIYSGSDDRRESARNFIQTTKKSNRHIVTFYYRRDKMFLCVCACTHIYKCKHERTKSARTASLNTSPCKICYKAFQHFLGSHVKSVRRLRKKGRVGTGKTKRCTALHDTAFEGPRYAVSKVTRRRIGEKEQKSLYRELCCRGMNVILRTTLL